MIEIAALITSQLVGDISKSAAKELYAQLKQKLVDKGVPKQDIKNLEEAEFDISSQNYKEIVARAREVSARLSLEDELFITSSALSGARDVTSNLRSERLRQAKSAFNAALVLLVLGILIIFGGVALMLFRDATTGGAVTTAVGAVVEVVSALLFKFSNDAQNRLDHMAGHLNAIEAAQVAVNLIAMIDDPGKRDDAVKEAATVLARLGNAPSQTSLKALG